MNCTDELWHHNCLDSCSEAQNGFEYGLLKVYLSVRHDEVVTIMQKCHKSFSEMIDK